MFLRSLKGIFGYFKLILNFFKKKLEKDVDITRIVIIGFINKKGLAIMSSINQWDQFAVDQDLAEEYKEGWIDSRVEEGMLSVKESGKVWLGKKILSGPRKGEKIYKSAAEMAYEHDSDVCDDIQSLAIQKTMRGEILEAGEITERLNKLVEGFLRNHYDIAFDDHMKDLSDEAEHSRRRFP